MLCPFPASGLSLSVRVLVGVLASSRFWGFFRRWLAVDGFVIWRSMDDDGSFVM